MLQSIGLSKKQLIKMLCYEGLMYSAFATLVTLVLGTGLGFLSVQIVVKTINPYFYYSFPWLIVLIYLVINIQNAFDLTQMGFWDCICRVKSQDDFTSTVNLTVNGHSPFMCRYNLSNQNKPQPMSKI